MRLERMRGVGPYGTVAGWNLKKKYTEWKSTTICRGGRQCPSQGVITEPEQVGLDAMHGNVGVVSGYAGPVCRVTAKKDPATPGNH